MSDSIVWFFVASALFIALLFSVIHRRTKSITHAYYDGLVMPILVLGFLFILPQAGVVLAFLSTMGILLIALVLFVLLNECSAYFRKRIEIECHKSCGINPVWQDKSERSQ
ncbi:MAG: hypothetical protein COV32_00490 [Candidatus Yonathbacteria bacterium CG10_big_fil_rev_8_21_14_0_10_43_136]|nr:MAG: hypothetical protein COW60_03590 [Candidatus Yonathbacteria bacterium CG17_big_fil_post_rev_8_21_14_2_50_43_9]PIR40972.1 MAG: hypothetical protein COV32_00490 [Candidatus Yonathbacteria bacterium CG10_big_fil_rev_8_21_14_0_10_43_136]PIX57439.1 MAG: hypothetical protein COZ48_00655 [Candidatus Yonathbacteria bacterium CG_4_10_14_3_um_filter_43_12]PJC22507.1 MAG: hypothetical protein CO060_00295 [Candidatus Yonathbacteria bacterium CG_4_9_14_0_2_um_filter_43_16]